MSHNIKGFNPKDPNSIKYNKDMNMIATNNANYQLKSSTSSLLPSANNTKRLSLSISNVNNNRENFRSLFIIYY